MNKLQEFWYCVAPQNDIPLYRGEALDGSVVAGLLTFLDYYRNNIQETFSESIQKALLHTCAWLDWLPDFDLIVVTKWIVLVLLIVAALLGMGYGTATVVSNIRNMFL